MEPLTVDVLHDSKEPRFALGSRPEDAVAVTERGSMELVVTNSIQVLNSVIFAALRL